MPRGRIFAALFLFCLITQAGAILRTTMPSQDGLKFIDIAREFDRQPAWDVVRSADQHPLYPMLVNQVHRGLSAVNQLGPPGAWRISAQLVSLMAMLAALWPIYSISRRLAGERAGLIAVFCWLVLPLPFAIGHETLSDALALCLGLWAIELGLKSAETNVSRFRIYYSIGSALAVAAAYWTRPEGLLAGLSIAVFQGLGWIKSKSSAEIKAHRFSRIIGLTSFCLIVGLSVMAYLWVNGSITDRLVAFTPVEKNTGVVEHSMSHLPKGLPWALRDASLDFSPKDESREVRLTGMKPGLWRMLVAWSEGLGIVLAVLCLSGLFRGAVQSREANWLIRIHLALLLLALAYQSIFRGYLSERHMLMVICLSLPFVGTGLMIAHSDLSRWLRLSAGASLFLARVGLGLLLVAGIYLQAKPEHASRRPHLEAGRWLAGHSSAASAVFDTRGWASFEAGRRRYDPYHIAQALSDRTTEYFVVESGELESGSGRAKTYARIINEGGELAAKFTRKKGASSPSDVLVFQWSRPLAWNDADKPFGREEGRRQIADSTAKPLHDDTIRPVAHRPIQEERRR